MNEQEELRRLREIHKAADAMAMAYAGEMSARSTGVIIEGFPILEAYQRLMALLWAFKEAKDQQ